MAHSKHHQLAHRIDELLGHAPQLVICFDPVSERGRAASCVLTHLIKSSLALSFRACSNVSSCERTDTSDGVAAKLTGLSAAAACIHGCKCMTLDA